MTRPSGQLPPCAECAFLPWSRTDPVCEADRCRGRATSWHHDRGGVHWLVCDRHKQPASSDPSPPRPAEISGSTLCSRQPCDWYTSHPSGVCDGCRQPAPNDPSGQVPS